MGANPDQPNSHMAAVNPNNSDLLPSVKQNKPGLDGYVNLSFSSLPKGKSEESDKNVNELDILIKQLKYNNLNKKSRRPAFEPIIRLTETLLKDNHSEAMFYKVLNALYPERLDLYVAAVQVALEAGEIESQINLGAVFVRALRDFAAEAGVDLGLRQTSDRDLNSQEEKELGTQVPNESVSLPPLAQPSVNEAIWAETQAVLRPQMTRATYDTIIQGTRLLGRENGNYIIGVQTEMAKEWLENRLRDIVRRALSNVIGVAVNVEFRLTNMNR
jgi:hypothetical protein